MKNQLTSTKPVFLAIAIQMLMIFIESPAFARRNNGFYQDPFDTGAGGSVLTWATQESMLMNNPALLPYGGKFLRWLGTKFNLMPGADSVNLAQSLAANQGSDDSSDSQSLTEGLDTLFNSPIHLGFSSATSLITSGGGFSIFASGEPDIRAWKRGDPERGSGTPSILVRSETYGGAYGSLAGRSLWQWLSWGVSAKYLMGNEVEERIEITDQDQLQSIQSNPQEVSDLTSFSSGTGLDGGLLVFAQGQHLDFKAAATITNLGGLSLTGGKGIRYPQMMNAGLGLTLHSNVDAIHFSVDYRDIQNSLEQPLYKHLYTGVRVTLRTYLGISAGLYHGSPSYGAEIDLILFRLAGAVYTREYADTPGLDARKIYIASLSIGAGF